MERFAELPEFKRYGIKEGKKTCMNCKFGVWKYDAFVCFRANMIEFTCSSSTCDRYENRQ